MEKEIKIINEKHTEDSINITLVGGGIEYWIIYESDSKIEDEFLTNIKIDTINYISNSTFPDLVLKYPDAILGCMKHTDCND